jgi:serine/threonine-protein phosphatase 2A regulatory subunit B
LEIEEKINKIRWCKRQNAAHFLISTNGTMHSHLYHRFLSYLFILLNALDKTVKLWKVFEKSIKVVAESNGTDMGYQPNLTRSSIKLPKLIHHDTMIAAIPRKVYQNAHAYHINSISVNSDGETFVSADDLRINLWNMNVSDQSFSMFLIYY